MPRKPPEGRRFQKGQSGNPSGRPKLPAVLIELKKVSRQSFEEMLQEFLRRDFDEVKAMHKSKDAPTIAKLVASLMVHAIENGCVQRTNFILKSMGINFNVPDFDPTVNMQPVETVEPSAPVEQFPVYVVEVNANGKFVRSRPREVLLAERSQAQQPKEVIDVTPETKTNNG